MFRHSTYMSERVVFSFTSQSFFFFFCVFCFSHTQPSTTPLLLDLVFFV
jgi:hypothetical protein